MNLSYGAQHQNADGECLTQPQSRSSRIDFRGELSRFSAFRGLGFVVNYAVFSAQQLRVSEVGWCRRKRRKLDTTTVVNSTKIVDNGILLLQSSSTFPFYWIEY